MPLCVSEQVERAISALARERGCQVHDLLIEAVELMLAKYGRPNARALSEDQHLQVNIPTSVPTIDMLCESLQMTLEKLKALGQGVRGATGVDAIPSCR